MNTKTLSHIAGYVVLSVALLLGAGRALAQEDADILGRINGLRGSLGLAGYTRNAALDAAAANHARWMVATGQVSHTQSDGSTPSTRAQAAGYSSRWVSENIYGGTNASVDAAWNFWINSQVHYRGLTSPNYQEIGVGIARGDWGAAYVLVFGTAQWNDVSAAAVASAGGGNSGGGGNSAPAAPPVFVVGVDSYGNIMHEIQPGDTLGDIALIYGYTWDDLPYMLEINGLTQEQGRSLNIGAVFLVPPQSGTYTPTPAPATETPTPTPEGELIEAVSAVATHTPTPPPPTATLTPTPTPTRMRIATMSAPVLLEGYPTATETPSPLPTATQTLAAPMPELANTLGNAAPLGDLRARFAGFSERQVWFMVAVGVQVLILLGAGIDFVLKQKKRS